MTKNNNVCNACIRDTGGCCTGVALALLATEMFPFSNKFSNGGAPEGHKLEPHDEESQVFIYKSMDDPCMFLDENNSCSIYDVRPTICRTYPLLWQDDEEENQQMVIDFACPLAHRLPIKTMHGWGTKNRKAIEMLGELDFNRDLDQYVSLNVIQEEVVSLEIALDEELEP